MKIDATEASNGFWFNLQPESIEDAAFLVRMGLNCAKKPPEIFVDADNKNFRATVVIGRFVDEFSAIRPYKP